MNAEVIFVKTDVMSWLISCRDVEKDVFSKACLELNMESSRIKGKTKIRWFTLKLGFLLWII